MSIHTLVKQAVAAYTDALAEEAAQRERDYKNIGTLLGLGAGIGGGVMAGRMAGPYARKTFLEQVDPYHQLPAGIRSLDPSYAQLSTTADGAGALGAAGVGLAAGAPLALIGSLVGRYGAGALARAVSRSKAEARRKREEQYA